MSLPLLRSDNFYEFTDEFTGAKYCACHSLSV